MSAPKPTPNQRRKRNSPRVPFILALLIGGGFVGMKGVKQVRATHNAQRLEVSERQLVAKLDELRLDILNQEGRIKELATRNVVTNATPRHGIRMVDVVKTSLITLPSKQPTPPQTESAQ
jgi:hypothetical protein